MGFWGKNQIRAFWKKGGNRGPHHALARKGFSRGKRFFERLVTEALESLPEELKNRLENVAILVEEDSPSEKGPSGRGQELLGLYHGISQKNRGFWYGNALPDRIIIYRKPLERISRNLEDLKNNVRETVIHEVGHYFGLDEEDLEALEDGEF